MVATVRDETEATFRLPQAESPHELDGGRSSRIADKLPDNFMDVGLFIVLFPKATFVQ